MKEKMINSFLILLTEATLVNQLEPRENSTQSRCL